MARPEQREMMELSLLGLTHPLHGQTRQVRRAPLANTHHMRMLLVTKVEEGQLAPQAQEARWRVLARRESAALVARGDQLL